MILLQAITDQGAISANWVLVGAFALIGVLLVIITNVVAKHLISMIDAIKEEVKALRKDVDHFKVREAEVQIHLTTLKDLQDTGHEEIIERLDKIIAS